MLFNSYIYIFAFLPITFFVYFSLHRIASARYAKGFLVAASLFFYAWWNPVYLPLIIASMLFNYLFGLWLSGKKRCRLFSRKRLLLFGIVGNVALLGYFKYSDFFIENINAILDADIPLLHLALPLAISFFTFQQIAYLVDSYRGETGEYDFLNYANFVTFFPQLIAGPIVHHAEMMPQFASKANTSIRLENVTKGLFLFSIGLFKKVIIADTFAQWATMGFDHAQSLTMSEAWVTSLSYTLQLYFDFSGYTDMALGSALLFNIRLPENFFSPYKAVSIQDFWRRWHMTLSRFLKSYVYIPLGGNKKGKWRTYRNLFVTFVIGGIWHGAGWTFLFWGVLHGIAVVVHRMWQGAGMRMHPLLAWFVTFQFINITWVFFRAKHWEDAIKVLRGMFGGDPVLPLQWQGVLAWLQSYGVHFGVSPAPHVWAWIAIGLVIVFFTKNSMQMLSAFGATRMSAFYAGVLAVAAMSMMSRVSEFLYFNF